MRFTFIFCLSVIAPAIAQQPEPDNKQPSAELLEFLVEFNMLSEHDDNDYDIIQYHALQDLEHPATLQERNHEH